MRNLRTMLAVVSAAALVFCVGCEKDKKDSCIDTPKILNLAGTWDVTITYNADKDVEMRAFNLTQTGSTLSGTSHQVNNSSDTVAINGTVNGNAVTLTENWGADGIYTYTGTAASATSMSGTSQYADGKDAAMWTATKQ